MDPKTVRRTPAIAYAQKRPSPRARHPMLVWHLGFWNPVELSLETIFNRESNATVNRVEKARRIRIGRAERYARALANRLRKPGPGIDPEVPGVLRFRTPHGQPTSGTFEDGIVIYEFDWWAFRATIRIELDAEWLAITTLLDLAPVAGQRRKTASPECNKTVDELRRLRKLVASIGSAARINRDQLGPTAEACLSEIWKVFEKEVLRLEPLPEIERGIRFADFRGVILGDQVTSDLQEPTDESEIRMSFVDDDWVLKLKPPQSLPHEPQIFQQPFWYSEHSRRDPRRPKLNTKEHWYKRFQVLWPLMTAKIHGVDLIDHEFTASVFDESALYLTALGAQPTGSMAHHAHDPIPLYYGLFTSGMGGWAIGRMVARIHELGMLRLSAIQDIDLLHRAESRLRQAELLVQRAFDRGWPEEGGRRGIRDRHEIAQQLRNDLEEIRDCMRMADSIVPGGVAYRIEKARHYIRRFDDAVCTLNVEAFDDLQPYPRFVDSRHRGAFRDIEMLESRNERLRLDIRTLYQRQLSEEGRTRTKEIVLIQKVAEFLTLAFLVPYYLGNIVAHLGWRSAENAPRLSWAFIFVLLLSVALLRLETKRRKLKIVAAATPVVAAAIYCLVPGTWSWMLDLSEPHHTIDKIEAIGTIEKVESVDRIDDMGAKKAVPVMVVPRPSASPPRKHHPSRR